MLILYLSYLAEGPPGSEVMQAEQSSQPDAAPVLQQSYRMQTLGSFDDEPAIITCKQCGSTGQTFTYKVRQDCHAAGLDDWVCILESWQLA